MNTQTCTYSRRGADGLAQIGLPRFDITGIRFMADNEGADGAGDAAAQAAAAAQQNDGEGSATPWTKDNFDPERAGRLVENLRKDLADQKTKTEKAIAAAAAQAQKDTLAQFAKLLAGEKEPETDPVKLAATIAEKETALTAAQAQVLEAQRTAAVAIAAGPLGADVAKLLADPTFKTTLASVDPTQDADIKSAITKALQANAALKRPPRSSGDIAPTGPTVQSLEAQLKAAEEKKDVSATIRLKRALVSARVAQKA